MIPRPAPVRAVIHMSYFRADYANEKRELDLKCNREYVLMPVVMYFVLSSTVSYSLCH